MSLHVISVVLVVLTPPCFLAGFVLLIPPHMEESRNIGDCLHIHTVYKQMINN